MARRSGAAQSERAEKLISTDSITELAKQCGLPAEATRALEERLERRHQPALRDIKRQDPEEMAAMFETLAREAMMAITPSDLAIASAKDKALVAAISIDKSLLLRGEATQIVHVEQREKLQRNLPLLLREAKRRGFALEVDAVLAIPRRPGSDKGLGRARAAAARLEEEGAG